MNLCKHCNTPTKNSLYCSNACQHRWQTKQKIENGTVDHRTVRAHLLKERGSKCEECGIFEWLGKPITMEMDHINGDHKDHSLANLKLLCPNCHSQTPTYKSRNRGNGRAFRTERRKQGKSF
jgi:hypothetical protein